MATAREHAEAEAGRASESATASPGATGQRLRLA